MTVELVNKDYKGGPVSLPRPPLDDRFTLISNGSSLLVLLRNSLRTPSEVDELQTDSRWILSN